LVIPFIFYVTNAKSQRDHNRFDRLILTLSYPFQLAIFEALTAINDTWKHYIALVHIEEDNERLLKENRGLVRQMERLVEYQHENTRLRQLLALRDRAPDVHLVGARVIGRAPTPIFHSLRIDRGQDSQLQLGAAVFSEQGAIGRIAALSEYTADVMLLVDANSSTDVVMQRTRIQARVRGTGTHNVLSMQVQYLPRSADIMPGDVLLTSGQGPTFPRGLTIGHIVTVEKPAFGLYQQATVEPSVDFRRVEEVWVVVSPVVNSASYEASSVVDPAETFAPKKTDVLTPP